jgi:hypothetical protein
VAASIRGVLPPIDMPIATLDPREARPLTSREISKVLCSIIGGVVTADPDAHPRVPAVLELVRKSPLELMRKPCSPASWETALAATVAGFYGWCKQSDIHTAIHWVDQNFARIFAPPVEN